MAKSRLLPAVAAAAGLMVSSLAWAQVQPPTTVTVPAVSVWGIALLGFLVASIGLRAAFSKRD